MNINDVLKPKLIVLDLDGTTLNSSNVIPDNLNEMLIFLKKSRSSRIVLASGRSIFSMKDIAANLGLSAPIITLNGGVIIDPISMEIYSEINLSMKLYTESLLILKKLKINFVIFTSLGIYAEYPSEITDILEKYTENEIKWISDFNTIMAPVKILFIPKSTKSNIELKKEFSHLDIDIIESGFSFTEIVPKGVNKGTALKIVANMLDIEKKDIIAFGDNENDIEMFQFSGTGVAMGNAPDHVKIKADIVTDTNDNDGVYKILKQVFTTVEENILI
ncbi:MAG: Cof-type HAD-IIB family hydrolase [Spirochaetia bacterium]|jgi:Cof subfamily protein (haloacid dehalogenase superfamily)|nr:Cof-type HAD-IIB family hydrolase [Spirochaetia bacterium]